MVISRRKQHQLFELALRNQHLILAALFFLIPVKLSLSYALLIPLILLWLHQLVLGEIQVVRGRQLVLPLVLFVAVAALSAPFGFHPLHSLTKLSQLFFCSALIPITHRLSTRETVPLFLVALVIGQALAALHTVGEAFFPEYAFRFFHGKVTESGQLALVTVICLGLILSLCRSSRILRSTIIDIPLGALATGVVFSSILTIAWLMPTAPLLRPLCFLLGISSVAFGFWILIRWTEIKNSGFHRVVMVLCGGILPLLFAALLTNLKRGPWLGVTLGIVVLLALHGRKLLIPLIGCAAALAALVEPIRERLFFAADHFFIHGGRSEIWSIGSNLAANYPLGIGFENSPILRSFSAEVPPELAHFHNNFLNIVVETGWLGLGCFIAWLWVCFVRGFLAKSQTPLVVILAHTIACALLSWQIAGLVEYNFGDSEVFLVAITLIGVLSSVTSKHEFDELLDHHIVTEKPSLDQQPATQVAS